MFSMRASDVISAITDQLLPQELWNPIKREQTKDGFGFVTTHQALIFRLDLRLSYYSEEMTINRSQQMFFVLCGHRHVWVAKEPADNENRWFNWKTIPMDQWDNTSNHDSCWRTDGLDSPISQVYFEMAESINAELGEEKSVAPKDMSDHTYFGLGSPFESIYVTHGKDPKDRNSYRRHIVGIEPIVKVG
jgi:hypothetical protein